MKQDDWDVAIAQARAKMGRLAAQAESMTDEQYKEFKIAEMERQRLLQIENIEELARTPNHVYAAKFGITEDVAEVMLRQYRDVAPEIIFERQLRQLRDMPASLLKERDLMQLRRIAAGTNTSPVPENLG